MVIEAGCPPHHWVIDAANGGTTSNGTCVKCGLLRPFRNSLDRVTNDWRDSHRENWQDDRELKKPDKRQTDNRF